MELMQWQSHNNYAEHVAFLSKFQTTYQKEVSKVEVRSRSSAVFGTSTENARIETWDLLRLCWTYVSPIFIFCIFLFAMIYYKDLEWQDYQYPKWSITVGWLLTVSSLSFIPIYMIYRIIITPGTFTQRVIDAFQPEKPGVNQAEHESTNQRFLRKCLKKLHLAKKRLVLCYLAYSVLEQVQFMSVKYAYISFICVC
ncbi:uncharacterized protein LOC143236313 [Tachypleus tridentatus]|uniref:uncharacterized protein LOC143236313 n=1 Tax=Tachypleus tridentatus TaxID=6853 RepID=UPI003FD44095